MDVLQECGPMWATSAWHMKLWAALLYEIPKQAYEYKRDAIAHRQGRIEELAHYFNIDRYSCDGERAALEADIVDIGKVQVDMRTPLATHDAGCMIVSVKRLAREWPNEMTVSVDFGFSLPGEVRIRQTNTPRRPEGELPTTIGSQRFQYQPHEEAKWLAKGAIRLVGPVEAGQLIGRPRQGAPSTGWPRRR
jgi:hypothetical protein